MVFHQISCKKPISLSEWPVWQWFGQPVWPKESTRILYQRSVIIYLSIYFGHSPTDLRSLPHSCLLAMTGARSCLERLLSLSSRSMNIVAGCPLEYLPCFGSQSWETVSFLVLQQWPLNCSWHDCYHKSKNIILMAEEQQGPTKGVCFREVSESYRCFTWSRVEL